MDRRIKMFDGRKARVQYVILMLLYRLAVNRWLFGIFCRALANWFSEENSVLIDLGDHREFRVYLNDGYWTRFFLYQKEYEPEVRQVLEAASGHVDLFCDLGANMGLWSVYGSNLFEQVIAVEASAKTFDHLERNTRALPTVDRHKAAIFAQSGKVLTFVNVHNSHASARLSLGETLGAKDTTETVTTLAIDDIVPNGQPALIKLDVEGAEIAAIDGAQRAIADGSVLIYEDHGSDRQSATSARILGIEGMRIYALENGTIQISNLADLEMLKKDRYKGYNFLAGRTDSPLLAAIVESFTNADRRR